MKEKTTKTDKTGIKIDKEVLKAGENNNLSINQMSLVNDIVKNISRTEKKTGAELYQDNLARQEVSTEVASVEFKKNLDKPKIKATLQEVLIDSNITKKSIIQEHQDIMAQARSINRVATARNCNKDFMELEGMTQRVEKQESNVYINNAIIDIDAIDKLIKVKQAI